MILCPNCHSREYLGTLFCSQCGAQLVSTGRLNPEDITTFVTGNAAYREAEPEIAAPVAMELESGVAIRLLDGSETVHVADRNEFTIGRVSEGQPILPDVDLSPFEAYSQGVSRLHVSVKIVNGVVFVTDLGSSNGTRINGQKLSSHVEYPLNPGDVMALGKLRLQIITR